MTYTNEFSVSNYDVLALEIKLEKDFNNSNGSYYDGEYDGKLGFEPSQENWLSADYRKGYLRGIEEKYNDKYELI